MPADIPKASCCHLHVHSEYSTLDGACRIENKYVDENGNKRTEWPLIDTAIQMGMPAVALTDHGTLSAGLKLQNACKAASEAAGLDVPIKPIIGMEPYFVDDRFRKNLREDGHYYRHLTLLAASREGYRNLCRFSRYAAVEGFYRKPRGDHDLLKRFGDGVIVLTGCMAGHVMQALIDEDKKYKGDDRARLHAARDEIVKLMDCVGEDNVYVEVQNNGVSIDGCGDQAQWNREVATIARDLGRPIVAAADVHYLRKGQPGQVSDPEHHDAMLCVQTKKLVSDANRMRLLPQHYHFRSPAEFAACFPEHPEAIANTLLVAERCNADYLDDPLIQTDLGFDLLPKFEIPADYRPAEPCPDGMDPDVWPRYSYLREQTYEGLARRYGDPIPGEARERAEMELEVVLKLGVIDYFLIEWDMMHATHRMGVLTGPGRGSAAGSIVAYALGITQLCPLEQGLLFERFLNPDRISMPDIDTDFSVRGRGKVIEYLTGKYHAAQLITFGKIGAKAAFRKAAQAEGREHLGLADKLAKAVPMKGQVPVGLTEALATGTELQQIIASDEFARNTLVPRAQWLERMVANEGVHAAAVLISPDPVHDVVPVQIALGKENFGTEISAFDMKDVEAVGLLKLDILGLKNLDIIDEAKQLILKRHGIDIGDVWQLPRDDEKTYKMLRDGEAVGTFQYESDGMRDALQQIGVSEFRDLVAVVALYRPGAMDQISTYAEGKKHPDKVRIPDPRLEPIIGETYGVILYQEQAMQISKELAGFTGGQADNLRKAIGKKDKERMAKIEPDFRAGCRANKVDPKVIDWVWETNEKSADYSFNRSHAACYALIGYVTAWLKAHYPREYMSALLSWSMSTKDKVPFYLQECRRMGIDVLPPDVNASSARFVPEGDTAIRFGMQAVKGAGDNVIDEIVSERETNGPYRDLFDYAKRVGAGSKKDAEALVKAGAFDSTGATRKGLLSVLELALNRAKGQRKMKERGQDSLFDALDAEDAFAAADMDAPPAIPADEFPAMERFRLEREAAGLYVSGHPLDDAIEAWEMVKHHGLGEIGVEHVTPKKDRDAPGVTVAGVVTAKKVRYTKTKGERMCIVTLDDPTGEMEVTFFPQIIASGVEEHLDVGSLVWVRAKVEEDDRSFGGGQGGSDHSVEDEDGNLVEAEPAAPQVKLIAQACGPFDPAAVKVPSSWDVRVPRHLVTRDMIKRIQAVVSEFPGDRPARLVLTDRGSDVKAYQFAHKVKPSHELRAAISAIAEQPVQRPAAT